MTALEAMIVGVETDLHHARTMYQRASLRGDVQGMFTWGQETRQAVQRLEELGEYDDSGRGAFHIGRER